MGVVTPVSAPSTERLDRKTKPVLTAALRIAPSAMVPQWSFAKEENVTFSTKDWPDEYTSPGVGNASNGMPCRYSRPYVLGRSTGQ